MSARMSRRTFFALALVVSLLVAVGLSFYASSHPDGLERVAEQAGFLHAGEESPTAGSPLADYAVEGVEEPWLSGGLAGLIGCLLVLALAGGLAWLLRRRSPAPDQRAQERAGEQAEA